MRNRGEHDRTTEKLENALKYLAEEASAWETKGKFEVKHK